MMESKFNTEKHAVGGRRLYSVPDFVINGPCVALLPHGLALNLKLDNLITAQTEAAGIAAAEL